jgi:hypothetical protein
MMNRYAATLLMILVTAAALAMPLATVSATPLPDYGAVAKCHYAITESDKNGWTEAELRRIAVTPPKVFAQSGTQTVGWRFVVRRSLDRENGPWKVTYRSPIQKGEATTSSAAAFDTMRVGVRLPPVEELQFVHYTVVLKMFWYHADGSLESKVGHQMSNLHIIVGGEDDGGDGNNFCPGLAQQFGP